MHKKVDRGNQRAGLAFWGSEGMVEGKPRCEVWGSSSGGLGFSVYDLRFGHIVDGLGLTV